MKDFTIAIYCFLDDLLLKMDCTSVDKRQKLSDAQVITIVVLNDFSSASANIFANSHGE